MNEDVPWWWYLIVGVVGVFAFLLNIAFYLAIIAGGVWILRWFGVI